MRSLRNLNIAIFLITALLLAALVFTGFRQNELASDYSKIVQESEGTIFFYTTIQDQAIEGLLSRDRTQLFASAKELEQLQTRYLALLDDPLISAQYKLSFMRDLDLGRVIVNLRNLAEKSGNDELVLGIMGQLRTMNKQFLQFDRIVVNEMRSRVM
jgi:cell division protein FtsB